jgi:ketopantoate reductase
VCEERLAGPDTVLLTVKSWDTRHMTARVAPLLCPDA